MSDRPQHRDGPPVALTDDEIIAALTEHAKGNAAATGAAAQAIQRIEMLREQVITASAERGSERNRYDAIASIVGALCDVIEASGEERLTGTRAYVEAYELLKGDQ